MMSDFDALYNSIDKEDSDLFYIEGGVKYVDLEILIDELGFRGIELSEEDQYTLFAELFFRDEINVNGLPEDFDPSRYRIGAKPTTPPPKPPVHASPTFTFQGVGKTCFAHVAANMIIHNIYKLTLDDEVRYIEKNCNQYLDTSKELEDYATIVENCGELSAKRILLFHYIYRIITERYGFKRGPLGNSILFYLQQPFRPDIFPDLKTTIFEMFTSKPLDIYDLSIVPIDKFDPTQYTEYFGEYYAGLHVRDTSHFFTIVGIDNAVRGKDSSTGKAFSIEFDKFQSHGTVIIDGSRWDGMNSVYLLFEKSNLDAYPKIVEDSIKYVKINVTPTPTRDMGLRAAFLGPPPAQPNFEDLGAEDKKADKGGRKTRKKKRRKTRRKRLTRYKL
jgi:hypothetical protein